MEKKPFRAVIVTAIPKEFKEVRTFLKEARPDRQKGSSYVRGTFSEKGVSWDVLLVETGKGNAASALETERALNYFDPQVTLFVGVAGGIKDVSIGDVVAASDLYTYEFVKLSDSKKGEYKIEVRPCGFPSSYELVQLAKEVSRDDEWLNRLENARQEIEPKLLVETIISGEKLVASRRSKLFEFLKANYNQAVALEMEGFGFLRAAHASNVLALVVRGISDLVAGNSKSDRKGSQELAAANASAFAFEILARYKGEAAREEGGQRPQGMVINVPDLPQNFFPRPEYLQVVKEALLQGDGRTAAITGKLAKSDPRLGLQGMAGIGKSVLAAALAHDHEVRQHFPDGVIWISLGTDPRLIRRQADLAEILGDGPRAFEDVQQGRTRLSSLLAERACLIVLVDVWRAGDVEAFGEMGHLSRMLITTRDASIITAFGARKHRLDVISKVKAPTRGRNGSRRVRKPSPRPGPLRSPG